LRLTASIETTADDPRIMTRAGSFVQIAIAPPIFKFLLKD
jgi:hypothetical protein